MKKSKDNYTQKCTIHLNKTKCKGIKDKNCLWNNLDTTQNLVTLDKESLSQRQKPLFFHNTLCLIKSVKMNPNMEIFAKILHYKNQIVTLISLSIFIKIFFVLAPNILTYFWPLFLSTTLLLVTILAFNNLSPLAVEFSNVKESEGSVLDFLSGHQHQQLEEFWYSVARNDHALRVRQNLVALVKTLYLC